MIVLGLDRKTHLRKAALTGRVLLRGSRAAEIRMGRIDFCHDFSPLYRRAREGNGFAIAFGTPVHWGCNDIVVADYRRVTPRKTVSMKIDATTLVNQIGMEQKRLITSITATE